MKKTCYIVAALWLAVSMSACGGTVPLDGGRTALGLVNMHAPGERAGGEAEPSKEGSREGTLPMDASGETETSSGISGETENSGVTNQEVSEDSRILSQGTENDGVTDQEVSEDSRILSQGTENDGAGGRGASEDAREAADSPEWLRAIPDAADSPEWLRAIPEARNEQVKQLFVVSCDGLNQTTATVTMHTRDQSGAWKQILETPAYVGRNGLCEDSKHWEGCGQTPMGTYRFNKAFGIADDPGCSIPYVKVDGNMYWSGDMREGMHYNEMVNIWDYPDLDLTLSEHIVDAVYGYQYCMNISFNEEGTAGRGSAIFLHCIVPGKTSTGGCIAVPEDMMKLIMQRVQPDCVVLIYTKDYLENGWKKPGRG